MFAVLDWPISFEGRAPGWSNGHDRQSRDAHGDVVAVERGVACVEVSWFLASDWLMELTESWSYMHAHTAFLCCRLIKSRCWLIVKIVVVEVEETACWLKLKILVVEVGKADGWFWLKLKRPIMAVVQDSTG